MKYELWYKDGKWQKSSANWIKDICSGFDDLNALYKKMELKLNVWPQYKWSVRKKQ